MVISVICLLQLFAKFLCREVDHHQVMFQTSFFALLCSTEGPTWCPLVCKITPFQYKTWYIVVVRSGLQGILPISNFWQCHSAKVWADVAAQSMASYLYCCSLDRCPGHTATISCSTQLNKFSLENSCDRLCKYLLTMHRCAWCSVLLEWKHLLALVPPQVTQSTMPYGHWVFLHWRQGNLQWSPVVTCKKLKFHWLVSCCNYVLLYQWGLWSLLALPTDSLWQRTAWSMIDKHLH